MSLFRTIASQIYHNRIDFFSGIHVDPYNLYRLFALSNDEKMSKAITENQPKIPVGADIAIDCENLVMASKHRHRTDPPVSLELTSYKLTSYVNAGNVCTCVGLTKKQRST